MVRVAVPCLITATSCIESKLVDCGNGLMCPVGLTCVELPPPQQRLACPGDSTP
jgi:hypothetical protein